MHLVGYYFILRITDNMKQYHRITILSNDVLGQKMGLVKYVEEMHSVWRWL